MTRPTVQVQLVDYVPTPVWHECFTNSAPHFKLLQRVRLHGGGWCLQRQRPPMILLPREAVAGLPAPRPEVATVAVDAVRNLFPHFCTCEHDAQPSAFTLVSSCALAQPCLETCERALFGQRLVEENSSQGEVIGLGVCAKKGTGKREYNCASSMAK